MPAVALTSSQRKKLPYDPQGSIVDVWRYKGLETCSHGPVRTGKTRGLLELAYVAGCNYPGARILFTRKIRATLAQTVLQTWEDEVFPSEYLTGCSRSHVEEYRLPNGTVYIPCGLDNMDKVMSSEYDWIFVFEATDIDENDRMNLLTRLSGHAIPYRRLIMDCNPKFPGHWLKRAMDRDKVKGFPSTLMDNARWFDWDKQEWTPDGLAYRAIVDQLEGVERLRKRDGIWAGADGLIYTEWEDRHIIDRMPEGWEKWQKFRGIDFGYKDPFVCFWGCVSPKREIYIYREYVKTKLTVEEHAKVIKRLQTPEENKHDRVFEFTVADHDAEDRATLALHDIDTEPAIKPKAGVKDRTAWSAAFEPVKKRMREGKVFFLRSALDAGGGADTSMIDAGKPCGLLDEIRSYAWAEDEPGKPTREKPADGSHDHSCDVLRYCVHAVESRPEFGLATPEKEHPTAYQPDLGMTDEEENDDSGWDLG